MSRVVAFDALGTLFDLGDLRPRMSKPLHHATSLTLAGEWLPFDEIVGALDPDLAEKLQAVEAYPDARRALERVSESGGSAWVLTNGGRKQTQELIERAELDELVAETHSVEEVKKYKPHPDVYGLLPPDSCLVAAHAWDVVGAQSAGYDAVWVTVGTNGGRFRSSSNGRLRPISWPRRRSPPKLVLLDRNGLRQVARLIDVQPA